MFIFLLLSLCFNLYAQDPLLTDQLDSETSIDHEYNEEFSLKYIQKVQVPQFSSCSELGSDSAPTRSDLRTRINKLQAQVNIATVNANGDPLRQEAIRAGEEKLGELHKAIRKLSLCTFQSDLRQEMAAIGDRFSQNKNFLKKLDRISGCFDAETGSTGVSKDTGFVRSTFDAIFNTFWTKAKTENLTKQDCDVLRKTYSVWSSFYDDLNQKDESLEQEPTVPLYNVNPHNSAYYYWMQEKNKGTIPEQGLPLLHVDTHTDLGHIHAHSIGSGIDALSFTSYSGVLSLASQENRSGLIEYVNQAMQNSTYSQESKDALIQFVTTRPFNEIVNVVNQSTRMNVHSIAQPLVAAAATGVTRSTTMVLPPWSRRLTESRTFDDSGRVVPVNISINESVYSFDEGRTLNAAVNIKNLDPNNNLGIGQRGTSPIETFNPDTDSDWTRPTGITFDLAVSPLSREQRSDIPGETVLDPQATSELRDFADYLPAEAQTDGFILDIDLDAFVSNGNEDNPVAEPLSYGRTQFFDGVGAGNSSHGGHEAFNELDPNTEVLSTEMSAIKQRMDSFFERLDGAKARGVRPKVITIADSTTLMRAMEGQEDDSMSGGNFTPSCMAFLLNYMVRQRLESLYNVDAVSSD